MAALAFRKGVARIKVPDRLVVPRPLARAGLLCRPGCSSHSSVLPVGHDHVWVTRWETEGAELPYGQDWLWYFAILGCLASATGVCLLVQSLAEVHRLAIQLGAGTTGGAMTRLASAALSRLCQARFGWARVEQGYVSLDSQGMNMAPLLVVSSGLADACWGRGQWPAGVVVETDERLWIRISVEQAVWLKEVPFYVPKYVIRGMAGRMDHLSIALVVAGYAQATRTGITLPRRCWEKVIAGITTCPCSRMHRRLWESIRHLQRVCAASGNPGAITVHSVEGTRPGRNAPATQLPGRPQNHWAVRILPAGPPFVRG